MYKQLHEFKEKYNKYQFIKFFVKFNKYNRAIFVVTYCVREIRCLAFKELRAQYNLNTIQYDSFNKKFLVFA